MMQATVSVLVLVIAVSAGLAGQMRRQAPAGGPEYDPARETTVSGTIVRSYVGPLEQFTIVEITREGQPLHLFLAPPEVMKKQAMTFTAGAAIQAIGVPGFKVNGGPAMLIRQIASAGRTLTLRDAAGKPTWQ
jgi:hypothetical protein